MGTILFTWELGGGLGHLMTMSSLAKALAAEGHRVVVATKDVLSAHRVFAGSRIELLGTPRSGVRLPYPKQFTFAHLLANMGFHDSDYLESHCGVWKNVFDSVRPDVIVLNHSPVALLASWISPARRVVMGSGFFIFPDVDPLPAFRSDLALDWPAIRAVEKEMLMRVNALLARWRQAPLARLGELYAAVDDTFLTTYAELDHSPNRKAPEYFGSINDGGVGGKDPVWPNGAGKKIYGYLRNFKSLPQLLQVLNASKQPTLIFGEGIDPAVREHFTSKTLRFETERLNMEKAAGGCDLAVTHAGHNTTCMLLKAGKPCLMVPMQEEQGMVARRVVEHGAGLGIFVDHPSAYAERLKLTLEDSRYTEAAKRLAVRLNRVDLTERRAEMLRRVGVLIASKWSAR